MRLRQIGLIGAAIAFARSARGQRIIADARRKYDTPENRAKVNDAFQNARRSWDSHGPSSGRAH